jgi:CRISPR-associated protein Cas1
MQLVINSKGAYIRKRGECFEVTVDEKKSEISASKVQSILITTAVLISTDAILLAYENNIDIVFLDKFGNPFSRIWHSKFGSTALIRRRQLELSQSKEGVEIVKEWICEKIESQISLLEKLARTRENKKEMIEAAVIAISEQKSKLAAVKADSTDEVRNTIMAYEGAASRIYFETIAEIVPPQYKFDGRSRNPAQDYFNAFLNYGYGILYGRVERACVISGLDPYSGFLHTDNYGKKSFVFDIIELFRSYVDEIVIKLFSKRMVKQEMCREIKNGFTLEKEGKQLIVGEFNKEMEETIRYRGRNIKKCNVIEFECHRIANKFIGESRDADMVGI